MAATVPSWAMQIDGAPVVPVNRAVSLRSLTRGYDGPAELVFTVRGNWTVGPFRADQRVTLYQHLPGEPGHDASSSALIFEGLLSPPNPVATAGEPPALEYRALDRRELARHREARLANETASPEIAIPGERLDAMVARLIEHVGETLTAIGISDQVEFLGGAGAIQGVDVSLSAATIDEALEQVARAAPGVRLMLQRPVAIGQRPRYTCVYVLGLPTYNLLLDRAIVEHLAFTQSFEGCCGAVRTRPYSTWGTGTFELKGRAPLTPAWGETPQERAALELQWNERSAFSSRDDLTEDPLSLVFRAWRYPADLPLSANTPILGRYVVADDEQDASRVWQRVRIVHHDPNERLVIFNSPAVRPLGRRKLAAPGVLERGRCKAAKCEILFATSQQAGGPIFTPSARWPEVGFTGPAVAMRPFTCRWERTIDVPPGLDALAYAQFAHAAMSHPVYKATIPLRFDLPTELWSLNRRLNIRTAGAGTTQLENIEAPLLAVSADFERREVSMQLGLDAGEALRGGIA